MDSGFGDYKLLVDAKKGDNKSLLRLFKHYDKFLKSYSINYFVKGASKEDVFQESLIGLYKAVRDYDFDQKLSFKNFAKLCVRRQVLSAINRAHCYKHEPLHRFKPLHGMADFAICNKQTDPAKLTILKEQLGFTMKKIEKLPLLEKKVLQLHHKGHSYKEIAKKLKLSEKSVDNALHRTRQKLRKALKDY